MMVVMKQKNGNRSSLSPLTPERAIRIGMETRMPGKAKGKARKKSA
jgi:hypothetical protein